MELSTSTKPYDCVTAAYMLHFLIGRDLLPPHLPSCNDTPPAAPIALLEWNSLRGSYLLPQIAGTVQVGRAKSCAQRPCLQQRVHMGPPGCVLEDSVWIPILPGPQLCVHVTVGPANGVLPGSACGSLSSGTPKKQRQAYAGPWSWDLPPWRSRCLADLLSSAPVPAATPGGGPRPS